MARHGIADRPHKSQDKREVPTNIRREGAAMANAANIAYSGGMYTLAGSLRASRLRLLAMADILDPPPPDLPA